MPHRRPNSPLGAFLQALEEEQIRCILIGGLAAIEQGAPVTTIDYDFWLPLPERQSVCILAIVKKLRCISLPLNRVIASKKAAGRDKDLATLPVLQRTLRLRRKLER